MAKGKKTEEALTAGRRVREAREALRISLAELSRRTGGRLTGPRIGNYEQGTRELDIRSARLLGPVLGVHAAYLMGLLDEDEHRFLLALRAKPPAAHPFTTLPARLVDPVRRTR